METLRYWNTKYDDMPEPWRTLVLVVPLFVALAMALIWTVWIAVIVFVLLLGFRLPIVRHPTIPMTDTKPDESSDK